MAVTIAIIGAGIRGAEIYGGQIRRRPDLARVVAVAEPDPIRRGRLAAAHHVDEARCFPGWSELLAGDRLADGVIIATPDREHVAPAVRAAKLGYHILLEKPVAVDRAGLELLQRESAASGVTVTVAHVLRYTPFFRTLGELLAAGRIGRLLSIQHAENVGYFHFAHSFVRGNWRRQDHAAPMILAKACHDMDLVRWLGGAPCARVASFGGLSHFRAQNAPPGSTERCTDGCAVERACPYSALRIYMERFIYTDDWPISALTDDPSPAGRLRALREGPYGRCVFRCDNDVADHQVVALELENGVSASLNVCGFTGAITRTVKLMGSEGEIRGHMGLGEIEVRSFLKDRAETLQVAAEHDGHVGGDQGLMTDFLHRLRRLVDGEPVPDAATSLEQSLDSHYMALAAEEARVAGRVVAPVQATPDRK